MKIIIERRITAGKDMRDYGSKLPNELARAGLVGPEGIRVDVIEAWVLSFFLLVA